jgi:Family of unknown function (DUF6463)
MLMGACWILVALGILHCLLGLVVFRKPIFAAMGDGFIGKFAGIPERRLAFWFIIFGPLLLMSGHVAVIAVADGNMVLLRVVGIYLFAASAIGATALPKSPFSITIFLAAFMVAGSLGWFS